MENLNEKEVKNMKIEENKRIDYQKTFDKFLTVESEDLEVNEKQEPLFIIANKIPVYLNNGFLRRSNALVACISINGETATPFIFVDSLFMKLSFKAQLFAIYHELGHYQNGDFLIRNNRNDLKTIGKNIFRKFVLKMYPQKETLADYYAMDRMNSIQDAMDSLKEINEVILKYARTSNDKKQRLFEKKMNALNERRLRCLKDKAINGPYWIDEDKKDYSGVIYVENEKEESEGQQLEFDLSSIQAKTIITDKE